MLSLPKTIFQNNLHGTQFEYTHSVKRETKLLGFEMASADWFKFEVIFQGMKARIEKFHIYLIVFFILFSYSIFSM